MDLTQYSFDLFSPQKRGEVNAATRKHMKGKILSCKSIGDRSSASSTNLIFNDIDEIDHPVPLLAVGQLEDIVLVAAVGGVVSLNLEGKSGLKNRESAMIFSTKL